MSAQRVLIGVANDKGGVGKSLTAATIVEELAGDGTPTSLVEIEQRTKFTQSNYHHPAGTDLRTIPLVGYNEAAGKAEPSLAPLDSLWDLIPTDAEVGRRIVIDFGASAFQSFLMWGVQQRGLRDFRTAGFKFVFFIPVQAADSEGAEFFNQSAVTMLKLGKVVLIKNFREGTDFSFLDQAVVAQVPSMTLLHKGRPLTMELQQVDRRLTFRQLAAHPSASRRARLDGEECADHFSKQFSELRTNLGL